METTYEIYALRYATMSPRTPNMNYITPDPHETAASDLDYFVWLIRGGGRKILVDTGFNAEEAAVRSRKLTLNPAEALTRFALVPRRSTMSSSPICIMTTPAISSCSRRRGSTCKTAR